MIETVVFQVRFQEDILVEDIFISPGSYNGTVGGKTIRFDFMRYAGYREDAHTLHVEHWELDTEAFPEAESVTPEDVAKAKWDEIFLFIDDGKGTDFHVDAVDFFSVIFTDGTEVKVPAEDIRAAIEIGHD